MRITAAVVREPGAPLLLQPVDLDDPQADEVLVRVAAVGICHTDLAVQHGHIPVGLPVVLGHEGAGVVEAVGADVVDLRPGDHVILSQALCGHCSQCRHGEPAYCENAARLSLGGRREDGSTPLSDDQGPISGNFVGQSSFATHAVAKARNAFRVDPDLPLELLAPIGCGVMTGAGAIFNDARSQPGGSVAVFGCGTVGLAAVMAARVAGCDRIVAIDVNGARLALATKLGATHTVVSDGDVVEAVRAVSAGGVDAAIEASGVPHVASDVLASTHTRGHTVIVGAAPFGARFDADWWTLAAGRRVQGSVIGSSDPAVDLPRLIDLWRRGTSPSSTW